MHVETSYQITSDHEVTFTFTDGTFSVRWSPAPPPRTEDGCSARALAEALGAFLSRIAATYGKPLPATVRGDFHEHS